MPVPIVPAVIPPSLADLTTAFSAYDFAPELSIDVVDGQFVPFTSWPYDPAGAPEEVAYLLRSRTVEIDLMVTDQVAAARAWRAAGADMLAFHAPGITPDAFCSLAADGGASFGISIPNDAPLTDLEPFLPGADYLQFMGIAHIGSQGQPFDTRVLDRIRSAKAAYPELPITVDGSVNADTIGALVAAGADRLIVGSAIVRAEDPAAAYAALTAAANAAQ